MNNELISWALFISFFLPLELLQVIYKDQIFFKFLILMIKQILILGHVKASYFGKSKFLTVKKLSEVSNLHT